MLYKNEQLISNSSFQRCELKLTLDVALLSVSIPFPEVETYFTGLAYTLTDKLGILGTENKCQIEADIILPLYLCCRRHNGPLSGL